MCITSSSAINQLIKFRSKQSLPWHLFFTKTTAEVDFSTVEKEHNKFNYTRYTVRKDTEVNCRFLHCSSFLGPAVLSVDAGGGEIHLLNLQSCIRVSSGNVLHNPKEAFSKVAISDVMFPSISESAAVISCSSLSFC